MLQLFLTAAELASLASDILDRRAPLTDDLVLMPELPSLPGVPLGGGDKTPPCVRPFPGVLSSKSKAVGFMTGFCSQEPLLGTEEAVACLADDFSPLPLQRTMGSGVPMRGCRPGSGLAPTSTGTGDPGSSRSTWMNWPSCSLLLRTRSSWSNGRLA